MSGIHYGIDPRDRKRNRLDDLTGTRKEAKSLVQRSIYPLTSEAI